MQSVARGRGLRPKLSAPLLSVLIAVLLLIIVAAPCAANTEIINFGPLLCRDDAEGRDEVFAAAKLSEEWPTLDLAHSGGIYSIALTDSAQSADADSRTGAWVRLQLHDGAESPASARAQEAPSTPRDRFFHELWQALVSPLTRRFTVRASIAANHAADVRLRVMTAHEMLVAGHLRKVPQSADAQDAAQDSTGAPVEPVVKIGDLPADVPYKDSGHDPEEDQRFVANARIAAAELADAPPKRPCAAAYLQVVAVRDAVPIPPLPPHSALTGRASDSLLARAWSWVKKVYFDSLAPERANVRRAAEQSNGSSHGPVSGDEEVPPVDAIPIALAFERLHLGVLPSTAAYLLIPLAAAAGLLRAVLLPAAHAFAVRAVASARAAEQRKATKADKSQ